jgi:hypothetical protein
MGHSSKHIGLDCPKWRSRMDSLGSLNAFVQAAEARNFTVAGRQLGVSSSAVGKAVARMEERLGVRFVRCTGRWRERDCGSRCCPRAESTRLVDPETRPSADRGHLHRRGRFNEPLGDDRRTKECGRHRRRLLGSPQPAPTIAGFASARLAGTRTQLAPTARRLRTYPRDAMSRVAKAPFIGIAGTTPSRPN